MTPSASGGSGDILCAMQVGMRIDEGVVELSVQALRGGKLIMGHGLRMHLKESCWLQEMSRI